MALSTRAVTALLIFGGAVAVSYAQQPITNGDFESGSFMDWTQTNQDNGSFILLAPGADTPAVAPDTATFMTAPNPSGGNFFAVTASGNPGTLALLGGTAGAGFVARRKRCRC